MLQTYACIQHTVIHNTQMNLSTVKWAQWVKTQSRELLVCSYVCASHCAQLLRTILHRTDLIIFPLTLQTITIAPMMSTWGMAAATTWKLVVQLNTTRTVQAHAFIYTQPLTQRMIHVILMHKMFRNEPKFLTLHALDEWQYISCYYNSNDINNNITIINY